MKGEGMDKVRDALALREAVTAIYLADNSDYLPALWSVVRALSPETAELLERDGHAAWEAANAKYTACEALSVQPADPMDTPLPCDVKVGHGTHRKGTPLRTLVARMKMLHEAAFGPEPTQAEKDANLAVLQGAQPAPSVPAVPEFCCEHAWSAAKQLAWKERDLSCDCDHNEYCQKCFPLEFRAGGKWDKYAAAPHPAAKGGAE